jgi:hypothetical protein
LAFVICAGLFVALLQTPMGAEARRLLFSCVVTFVIGAAIIGWRFSVHWPAGPRCEHSGWRGARSRSRATRRGSAPCGGIRC